MAPRLMILLCALLLGGCSRLLFMPMGPLVRTPADVGIEYRDVALRAADGTALDAWWLPARGPARGTVLFLHGNAENISTHLASVYWLPAEGYQVLLLDYRGFGRSGGRPAIPEVFADLHAALDWLAAEPDAQGRPLFLLGQSLGAALGGYLVGADPAVRARFSAVVLDAGFARYRWIARDVAAKSWLTWPLQWPMAWSMPRGYDLLDQIGHISPVPLLLIHGRQDAVVDYRHVQALFAAARAPRFLLSHDGPHIGSFREPAIRSALLQFLADPADGCGTAAPGLCRNDDSP
ncbi:MAG: alpha/beta fold hydrolase [Gammaproteobacteria bacterium]|nr:alpha/beta fold hydrolase [Gammaproteobacteria bacterium]